MSTQTENEQIIDDAPDTDNQPGGGVDADELESHGEAGGVEAAEADPIEPDEVVVSIGDETPAEEDAAPAAPWVRELRKSNRELARQNRELQARLQTVAHPAAKPVTLGAKPKLEDHDYDAEQFEVALGAWFDTKRQADEADAKRKADEVVQQRAWQAKLDGYAQAKSALKVRDFEDAEATAQDLFSVVQQGVMLQGADNPALVVYALGKNPKKSAELAAIKDPVKFAFAVAKLEQELKVTNRKAAPPPERVVTGTGRSSGAVDSTLDRLREEATRTGDMTKVIRYKAAQKKK